MEPARCRLFSVIGERMRPFITAKDNPKYKLWKSLSSRKHREKEGLFLTEGPVLIEEALGSERTLTEALIIRSGSEDNEDTAALAEKAESLNVKVYVLSGQLFDELTDTETGRDAIAVLRIPGNLPESVENGLVILDRIQDPGNMGTILRTAEAAGFDGVVAIKGTVDAFSPKVVRAAAGAVLRMPIRYVDSEEEAVKICREEGLLVVAGDPLGENLYEAGDLSGRTALVIGNEGAGVSDSLLARADIRAGIPMEGNTESLNAAVAAAIMMYEIVRQRGQMTCRKN